MNNRKFKQKIIKKALVIGGISLITSSTISYNVGKINGYKNGYEVGYEESKKEEKNIEITELPKENMEEEKNLSCDSASKYVLDVYNRIGKDLEIEDLGCALVTSPYLFKDKTTDVYIYDTTLFEPSDNLKSINDEETSVYIYVDTKNENRPIAGITEVNGKPVNVNVIAYSKNSSLPIKSDSNYYVNFLTDSEEIMQKYLDTTKDYYSERLDLITGRMKN